MLKKLAFMAHRWAKKIGVGNWWNDFLLGVILTSYPGSIFRGIKNRLLLKFHLLIYQRQKITPLLSYS